MKERPGFMLYFDLMDALSTMEDARAGALFKALMVYARTGAVEPLTGEAYFAFLMMRPRIDQDKAAYRERCRKSAYNAYIGASRRRGEVPMEYEEWEEANPCHGMPTEQSGTEHSGTEPSGTEHSGTERSACGAIPPVEYGEFLFSPQVKAAIEEWLRYKAERREQYTATGLRSLLAQVHGNVSRWGEKAVLALMEECMAAGYRGIVFDRLGKRSGGQPSQPEEDNEWMREYIRLRDKNKKPS